MLCYAALRGFSPFVSLLPRTVNVNNVCIALTKRSCDPLIRPLTSMVGSELRENESEIPKHSKELPVPDWESMLLEPLKKNIYTPHENAAKRSEAEVEQYRRGHGVVVSSPGGCDIPKPVVHYTEANFPSYINDTLIRKGLETPAIIPAQAWPILMSGLNMVGVRANSQDKILAYTLPAIMHIKNQPPLQRGDGPIVLVVVPARAQTQSIKSVADTYGISSHIQSVSLFEGGAKMQQARDFMTCKQIVVGTPRRLLRFLQNKTINLRRTTYLVVDEVDQLLKMGLESQLVKIINQIRPDRQVSVWSSSWSNEVQTWTENILHQEYIKLDVGSFKCNV